MGSVGTECFRCSTVASAEVSFHHLRNCFDDVVAVVVAFDVDDGGDATGDSVLLPPCIADEDGIRQGIRQVRGERVELRSPHSSIESVSGCCSCRTPGSGRSPNRHARAG